MRIASRLQKQNFTPASMYFQPNIAASSAVNTLYIGGGTLSVLPLSVLGNLVHSLGGGPWEEFTMEGVPPTFAPKATIRN